MGNDLVDDANVWAENEAEYLKLLTPAERGRRLARYGIISTEPTIPPNTTITIPFDDEAPTN